MEARSTRSCSSSSGELVLKRRRSHPPITSEWGSRRWSWPQGGANPSGSYRCFGLLGALQPIGSIRPHRAGRRDPLRPVPRIARRADLHRANRSHHAHHALEGDVCDLPTGWLDPEDYGSITATTLHKAFQGATYTAVISPEGRYLAGLLPMGKAWRY